MCTSATRSKKVLLHVDQDEEDYRMLLLPGYTASDASQALALVKSMGLEPLDEEEYPSEVLDDGSILVFLCERNPA